MRSAITLLVCLHCAVAFAGERVGTRDGRVRLFEEIVRKTLAREAFSPVKNERLGLDFERQAVKTREQFVAADTEAALLHAVVRLSNLRRDGHLEVRTVPGGPRYGDLGGEPYLLAPVRFAADFGAAGQYFLFVSDVDAKLGRRITAGLPKGAMPEFGDKLISVNGRAIGEYLAMMEPYIAYSTVERLWIEFAVNISARRVDFGPELYDETIRYTLEKNDGRRLEFSCSYGSPSAVAWAGPSIKRAFEGSPHETPQEFTWTGWAVEKSYAGFRRALATESFTLYLPLQAGRKIVLLDWHFFMDDFASDLAALMRYAAGNKLLSHDVICDLTTSRGGQTGWQLVQRLSPRPFRMTHGNLRISDVTAPFIERRIAREAEPGGAERRWLVDWLRQDVRAAIAAGRPYTDAVPFKLQALPKTSDGVLPAAEAHFKGRLVCLFGPLGRSQVDQLAAMVIDNKLGHSIGMCTAGSSNTWEWRETVAIPGGGPVAEMMWSIGQTIRPNGEVLEGNPARPVEMVAMTRENYRAYYSELVNRAVGWLEEGGNIEKSKSQNVETGGSPER